MVRRLRLLIRPLAAAKSTGIAVASGPNHAIMFRRFQHFAIQVGDDFVHEVVRMEAGGYGYRTTTKDNWWKANNESKTRGKSRVIPSLVGQTSLSNRELGKVGSLIWAYVLEKKYRFFSTNCQTFAFLFVALTNNNLDVSPEKSGDFREFPALFNPQFASGALAKVSKLPMTAKSQKHRLHAINQHAQDSSLESAGDIKKIIQKAMNEYSRRARTKKWMKSKLPKKRPQKLSIWSKIGVHLNFGKQQKRKGIPLLTPPWEWHSRK